MNGRQFYTQIANMNVFLATLLYALSVGFAAGLLTFYFGGTRASVSSSIFTGIGTSVGVGVVFFSRRTQRRRLP